MPSVTDRSSRVIPLPIEGIDPRRLAAFVHADIVGYSRLIGLDDIGVGPLLAEIRHNLIDPALARFGGRVVNGAGDSVLMEFGSIVAAVRCAIDLQAGIPGFDKGLPPERRVRYRMGVNIGDAISDDDALYGDGVNIAARLQAVCEPGAICVSRAVRDEVAARLSLTFEPMGNLEFKNIARPVEAFLLRIDAVTAKADPSRRSRLVLPRRPWPAFAGLVLLLLCGALAAQWEWRTWHAPPMVASGGRGGPDVPPPLSIAVLPFDNLSNDVEQGYLAEGISDDLTTDLSHLRGAFVIARESAFAFKGHETNVHEIGQQLGVRFLLEGSVRKIGDVVRVNAQLVSTDSGAHLWAERFDEPIRTLAAGQDRVVSRIGAALGVQLAQPGAERRATVPSSTPDAYELVLRARATLKEPLTEERNTIAAGLFEQALRLDPFSVPAMAGVGMMLIEVYGPRYLKRASDLIAEAEHDAPRSPDMLAAKFVLQRGTGQLEEATTTLQTLLDIDSSAAGLAAQLGYCGCWGLPDIAIPLLERILRLDPRSSANSGLRLDLGRELIEAGRNDGAIAVLDEMLASGSSGFGTTEQAASDRRQKDWARLFLASAYAWSDRLDDARRSLDLVMRSSSMMDVTVRLIAAQVRHYDDPAHIDRELRLINGLRRAGLRDHLDEDADSKVPSDARLRRIEEMYAPTPMTVPGGITIKTAELQKLLAEQKPLVLTTASANPSIPGAILIDPEYNSGSLDDVWQARLHRMMEDLTSSNLDRPIVTFAFDINRWNARNLALRLIALGYTHVYWYRGGWEAWDAHDLSETPAAMQLR
jgi:adenylate cyclase